MRGLWRLLETAVAAQCLGVCALWACTSKILQPLTELPSHRRYLVSLHPEVERKLAQELADAGLLATPESSEPRAVALKDLTSLPYLGCAIKVRTPSNREAVSFHKHQRGLGSEAVVGCPHGSLTLPAAVQPAQSIRPRCCATAAQRRRDQWMHRVPAGLL